MVTARLASVRVVAEIFSVGEGGVAKKSTLCRLGGVSGVRVGGAGRLSGITGIGRMDFAYEMFVFFSRKHILSCLTHAMQFL